MAKLKKDAERFGHQVKKAAKYIGHEIKENTELAEHEQGAERKDAKSIINKMKEAL